jgi:hypothetical protein
VLESPIIVLKGAGVSRPRLSQWLPREEVVDCGRRNAMGVSCCSGWVAVAKLEAGMISKRTKDVLVAVKRAGKRLGRDRGVKRSAKARAIAAAAITDRAATRQPISRRRLQR